MFCTHCGHESSATDKFCGKCGEQLSHSTGAIRVEQSPSSPPIISSPSTKMHNGKVIETGKKWGKKIGYFILLLIALGVAKIVGKVVAEEFISSPKMPTRHEIAVELRKQFAQQHLPKKIDDVTIFTSADVTDSAVTYNYSIHDVDVNQFPDRIQMRTTLNKQLSGSKLCDPNGLMDFGFAVVYKYVFPSGATDQFSFSYKDCKRF